MERPLTELEKLHNYLIADCVLSSKSISVSATRICKDQGVKLVRSYFCMGKIRILPRPDLLLKLGDNESKVDFSRNLLLSHSQINNGDM